MGDVYNRSTYRYYNSSTNQFTKYTDSDGLTTLQPDDDAATVNYGGRTPTEEEWQELIDNTTHQWVTINGMNGHRFTSSNGNSLFLPAAGLRGDSSLYAGTYGYYWSSSISTGDLFRFYFDPAAVYVDRYADRVYGHPVRAVRQN